MPWIPYFAYAFNMIHPEPYSSSSSNNYKAPILQNPLEGTCKGTLIYCQGPCTYKKSRIDPFKEPLKQNTVLWA